jgi:hypothetical protein
LPGSKVRNPTLDAFWSVGRKAFSEHLWPSARGEPHRFSIFHARPSISSPPLNSNYPSDYTLLICNVQSTPAAALFEQAPDVF